MMKSNVTLKSNVYINKSAHPDDVDFLQHIRDYRVLKRKQTLLYGSTSSGPTWLTDVQKRILKQGSPECAYERGTMSWGVPIGGEYMHCRCEEFDCRLFDECSKYRNFDLVQRNEIATSTECNDTDTTPLPLYNGQDKVNPPEVDIMPAPDLQPSFESETNSDIPPEPDIEPAPSPQPVTKPLIDPVTHIEEEISDAQVVSQTVIIDAPIADRVWVNAGPGTGKTYTVIQRIKKLLTSELEGSILVLCFSRNAVQVIRERLTAELGFSVASYIEGGSLVIRTFDSFATYMLEDELNPSWDYNKRIEEFIKMLGRNPGALDDMFKYLIVDEIQDTVGVRARMLLAMLDEITCGVLLLGDRCQAIFDWTIRDTADMTFDRLTTELSRRHFKQFELEGNRRQSKELAKMGQELRESMLNSDEHSQEQAIDHFKNWLSCKWRSYDIKALPQFLSGACDLILCKTNGEAAHISQRLFDTTSSVDHAMKQSSSHRTLAPWIAKLLCGCDGQYMTKEAFIKNGNDYDITNVEEKWAALKSIDNHPHAPILHVRDVLDALLRLDSVPECCLNDHKNCAVVSTVHRAKGSEADHVFWLNTPLVYDGQREQEGALCDALNAAYVAATRAKSDIHLIEWNKRPYLRLVNENRWIEVGLSKNKNQYCKGIALLPEDTDPYSFATEDIQIVLSCLERGMPVTLYPNDVEQRCDIFFDGQMIGSTSKEFTKALFAGFAATNHTKNWPSSIPDVYIASIVTIVAPGATVINKSLAGAGCWLGIELGGFPRIEWY